MASIGEASMVPAFVSAMQDRALRGHARELYVWMYHRLDPVLYRPLKHSAIDLDMGIGDVAIKRAIDRLVECGYIDRGPRDGRVWTYRLVHSIASRSVSG